MYHSHNRIHNNYMYFIFLIPNLYKHFTVGVLHGQDMHQLAESTESCFDVEPLPPKTMFINILRVGVVVI